MRNIKTILLILTGFASVPSIYATTPYAGQQHRQIKALSVQDMQGLQKGSGMGMAKAAELNHYPGPKHVLELATELKLTPQQRQQTETVFASMHKAAVRLGEEVIALEQLLDQLFVDKKIDYQVLQNLTLKIGQKRGELQGVHLQAHLDQRQLLTEEQLQHYDKLRGYTNASHEHHNHQH